MSNTRAAADAFRSLAKSRHSCRRFQPNRPLPKEMLNDMLQTTLTSPSGFNIQPTNVIILQNQDMKQELAKTSMLGAGNIYRTIDSSAVAVFLSDLQPHKRLQRIIELEKESGVRSKDYLSTLPIVTSFLMGEGKVATLMKQVATDAMSPVKPMPTIDTIQAWSYKNTALVAQTFTFAATSHGLSTCLMEGYDSRRVRDVLKIPDRYDIPLMCGVGYEYEEDEKVGKTPRLKMNEVFFSDTFGKPIDTDMTAVVEDAGESPK